MRDYLEFSVHLGAKWVTSNFVRGRRLAFYGIGAAFTCLGSKIEMHPVDKFRAAMWKDTWQ
jgi:hypothetical protein